MMTMIQISMKMMMRNKYFKCNIKIDINNKKVAVLDNLKTAPFRYKLYIISNCFAILGLLKRN